jgi:hypothetical protein
MQHTSIRWASLFLFDATAAPGIVEPSGVAVRPVLNDRLPLNERLLSVLDDDESRASPPEEGPDVAILYLRYELNKELPQSMINPS